MFDAKEKLPERGKEVEVFIDNKKHNATLIHNDWLVKKEGEQGHNIIETMAWKYSNKYISYWKYK